MEEISLTQEQVSDRVGKKRSTIANYLRLLRLDPIIQTGIRDGFITMGHGRAIINIEDLDAQTNIYHQIITENLSVRETEALVKKYQEGVGNDKQGIPKKENQFIVSEEDKRSIGSFFGAKIDIKVSNNGKGKISIPFHSEEDLNRIIKLLKD
jgi:ParB family chromosome partitioning protein